MEVQFKWCMFHENWSIIGGIGGVRSWNKGLNLAEFWLTIKYDQNIFLMVCTETNTFNGACMW